MGLLMESRGQVLVLIIVFGILLSATPLLAYQVEANPFTEVTVDLQEEPASVDVSPYSSGIVTIQGTVTCKKWGPDQVKVYLEANSTHDGANVNPPSRVFSGSSGSEETAPFSVTTRVPQGVSSSESVTVTVGGYYLQGSMESDIEPDSALIIVEQYYMVEVYAGGDNGEGFNLTAKSGENVDLELIIHNAGNGNDIFEIDFENRDELESDGLELPEPVEIFILEKGNEIISLRIGTPEVSTTGFSLVLIVLSKGSLEGEYIEKVYTFVSLLVEEKSIAERIGSIILSPLVIILIVVIILVSIIVWLKRRG
jgi:hypothetical protein